MEPGGSSPCSQEPSTGPYLEPDESNPYNPILSIQRNERHFISNTLCAYVLRFHSIERRPQMVTI
jgi:hypothetical protein